MSFEFARTDGTQLFVKSSDVEGVLSAIEAYVAEHGCSGMFEAVDDRIASLEERRDERAFALATPERGWIAVWEDGVWGDRRLARHLSERLGTEVRWLMVSSSTDSWAFFAYEDGEEVDSAFHEDVDDAVAAARAVADREGLPHALRYLRDPNLGDFLAGLDVPAVSELGIDIRAAAAEVPADPGPDGLVEESMPCRGRES